MWPRVAGGPSNKFVFHARSQERCQFLTSANCKCKWSRMGKRLSVPRSSSLRESIIITRGVSNFASFARKTKRDGCKGARACGYYRANYGAGSIHLRTKSMTNQLLTANGNEPAPRINLKRVGQANYTPVMRLLHIGRCLSMSAWLVREKACLPHSHTSRIER